MEDLPDFNETYEELVEVPKSLLLLKLKTTMEVVYRFRKLVEDSPLALYLQSLERSSYGTYIGDTADSELSAFSYEFAGLTEDEVIVAQRELLAGGWEVH